jgi:ATP-dependent DNA ligase
MDLCLSLLASPNVWVEPFLVMTVVEDEITHSPFHAAGKPKYNQDSGHALRLPRIQRFIWTDKRAEDATMEKEVHDLFILQRRRRPERT